MSAALPEKAVVKLGDDEVGILTRAGEHSRFEPAEAWADRPAGERPVLGQQFEEDPFAAHLTRARLGVPLWFEHLLPEADGPLRAAVARASDVSVSRGFAILLLLGDDLPGAVRVRAVEGEFSLRTVSRRVREALSAEGTDALPLRVSLAGVQFKISARLHESRFCVPGWDQEGDWIVKFPDSEHADLPQIEYVTMLWAGLSGIAVPEVRLVRVADIEGIESLELIGSEYAFAIARYDRTEGGRVHQEDMAQVLGLAVGNAKYTATNIDTILNVVRTLAPGDVEEFIRRCVFLVVSGNDDAHAKNWSLWYPDRITARLSPAYDLVSTLAFPRYRGNAMALKLARVRRFEDVTLGTFARLGTRTGLDPDWVRQIVIEGVAAQAEAWAEARRLPECVEPHRSLVDERLERLPLVREALLEA